jgi:hypothetical protein
LTQVERLQQVSQSQPTGDNLLLCDLNTLLDISIRQHLVLLYVIVKEANRDLEVVLGPVHNIEILSDGVRDLVGFAPLYCRLTILVPVLLAERKIGIACVRKLQ